MLIVIEGLDGAGKSTQVKKLRQYLEEKCGKLEYIHFPRYEAPVYGGLISEFLSGTFGSIDKVHPKLVALLYAEDRRDAAPAMKKVLAKGECMLLDRYVYSNVAYQCAKIDNPEEKENLREWINNTEYGNFDLPRPDLNLFLDVPLSFIASNLDSVRKGLDKDYLSEGKKDIHEADISFQKKVREVYLRQCEVDPKFIRLDCSNENGEMLPPDDIFAKIKAAVDTIL